MKTKPDTRGILCHTHGGDVEVDGYFVCTHVMKGAPVKMHIKIGDDDEMPRMGQLICKIPANKHSVDDLTIMCVHCARSKGLVKGD